MGNSAKLGRSFADFRNVCIFALPKYRSSPGFGPGSQRRHRRYGRGGADFRLGLCCAGTDGFSCWSDGRVARQRSAKPCTAVRIRFRPHRNRVADSCNAVFVWYKYNMYFFRGMVAGRFRLAGYEVMDENYDFPLIPPYPFYYSLFVAVYFLPGSIG